MVKEKIPFDAYVKSDEKPQEKAVSEFSGLLSGLSPVELLDLGWELRGCLEGSVHDGRDVVRSLLGNPILAQYANAIGPEWTINPIEALGKVKRAIRADLAR